MDQHINQYIEKTIYNPPDHEKIDRTLRDAHMVQPGKAIILLAYHAGLQISEMIALKGTNIKESFSFIEAPDGRTIPITPRLAEELNGLYWLHEDPELPIIYSELRKKAMSRMHATRLAKEFMNVAESPEVRLSDLRTACIINWMQEYPWEYVSQISGMKMSVLTQRYQHYLPQNTIRKQVEPIKHTEVSPNLIHEILQKHTNDLVGLILRLIINHRLAPIELTHLTWDMVDWEEGIIRFQGKMIPITEDIVPCLKVAREQSHINSVFAFPNTQTPYTNDTFSYRIKKALLQDGYMGLTAIQLIRATEYLNYRSIVHDLLEEKGRFEVKDICQAANIHQSMAYKLLDHLQQAGEINQIGYRFYSSKTTVSPDKFKDVVKKLDKQTGGNFTGREFAEEIGIDLRSAVTQLNKLIANGEVHKVNRETYAFVQEQE